MVVDEQTGAVEKAIGEPFDAAAFLADIEPRLRRALVAAHGAEVGREAAADALTWALANPERIAPLDNPVGYLWRVGQTAARRERQWWQRRSAFDVPERPAADDPDFDPRLVDALARLSPRQRAAVVLVHGWHYRQTEAAETMGCSVSSLRVLRRGMDTLRDEMGVSDE